MALGREVGVVVHEQAKAVAHTTAPLRTFTANDFKYLNPAVAVDDKWMYKQMSPVRPQNVGAKGPAGTPARANLRQEGQLHGGC